MGKFGPDQLMGSVQALELGAQILRCIPKLDFDGAQFLIDNHPVLQGFISQMKQLGPSIPEVCEIFELTREVVYEAVLLRPGIKVVSDKERLQEFLYNPFVGQTNRGWQAASFEFAEIFQEKYFLADGLGYIGFPHSPRDSNEFCILRDDVRLHRWRVDWFPVESVRVETKPIRWLLVRKKQ